MLKIFCLTATTATAIIALFPLVTMGKAPTYNHRNQWGLGLDLPLYCQVKYGPDAAVTLQENNALGWGCTIGTQVQDIAFDEACSMQYGPSARPGMGDFDNVGSWHCRLTKNVSNQASGS